MKPPAFPKKTLGISWDVNTRRMQVEDKDHRVTTFFNVSEEDFDLLKASKFPGLLLSGSKRVKSFLLTSI
jgi:hypothetical protein